MILLLEIRLWQVLALEVHTYNCVMNAEYQKFARAVCFAIISNACEAEVSHAGVKNTPLACVHRVYKPDSTLHAIKGSLTGKLQALSSMLHHQSARASGWMPCHAGIPPG